MASMSGEKTSKSFWERPAQLISTECSCSRTRKLRRKVSWRTSAIWWIPARLNFNHFITINYLKLFQVPNLFTTEEKMEICEKMRQLDRQRDKSMQTDGSPAALFNFFVQIVREQLHIVLAMSPIGDSFRNRIRKFPALVNCCTIDWFQVKL